jgi:alpha-ketoglutarate-dependent taurine dioxygenase
LQQEIIDNLAAILIFSQQEGDIIIIDNLAVAHRATVEAHSCPTKQGLRILHRTTVRGMVDFDAQSDFGEREREGGGGERARAPEA